MNSLYTLLIVAISILCTGLQAEVKMVRHKSAEVVYDHRLGQKLTEAEKKLVGKWYGKVGKDEYEIDRRSDGTYQIVYRGIFDGERFVDYMRGAWWIREESYYYLDLESSYQEQVFENKPIIEKIVEFTDSKFVLITTGDSETETVREKSIEKFRFDFWESIGLRANKPE